MCDVTVSKTHLTLLLFLKYQGGININIINSKMLKQSSIQILKYDLSLRVQWKSFEDTGTVNNPVQFSRSAMPNSLGPHGLQHARLPCPSPTPGAYANSCPSSQGCHANISSSVIPFTSWLQSSPVSRSFPVSQFFASGVQRISFSFSISPSSEYSGLISFRTDWFDLLVVHRTLIITQRSCYLLHCICINTNSRWSLHSFSLSRSKYFIKQETNSSGFMSFLISLCYWDWVDLA